MLFQHFGARKEFLPPNLNSSSSSSSNSNSSHEKQERLSSEVMQSTESTTNQPARIRLVRGACHSRDSLDESFFLADHGTICCQVHARAAKLAATDEN